MGKIVRVLPGAALVVLGAGVFRHDTSLLDVLVGCAAIGSGMFFLAAIWRRPRQALYGRHPGRGGAAPSTKTSDL